MICGACGRQTDYVIITIDREGDCPGLCQWCTTKRQLLNWLPIIMLAMAWVLTAFVVLTGKGE